MKDLIITGAAEIATPIGHTAKYGREMKEINIIKNGAIYVHDGKIAAIGNSEEIESLYKSADCELINAAGKSIIPGFVDSHTHFLFGGYREDEFSMRLEGQDYLSIMAAGGGIANTVKATRRLSAFEMFELGIMRLDQMLSMGVTTVEGKSGYGLDLDTELSMLSVQHQLNEKHTIDVVSTYLGAHAIPEEFKDKSDAYIDYMIDTVLPQICEKELAEFCDVFCEEGVFSVSQSEKLLTAAKKMGFNLKIHADEITDIGGAVLAARLGAISAEHLLTVSDKSIKALSSARVIATLLPSTAFCLNKPFAAGRKMIDAGCAVAIASDFNPGSCFTNSIPLLMSLACIKMGLTIGEVLTAITLNGAAALNRADKTGSIEVGKNADFLILSYPSYKFLVYNTAVNIVEIVIKGGQKVYSK